MAGQGVNGKQDNVDQENQAADANAKLPVEKETLDRVVPQENQEKNREIKKIAMHILQNKWKSRFATIFAVGGLAHSARRRIEKKCAIVRFTVVVTRGAKYQGTRQHQKRGRERPPVMLRIDERGIKRRKIRSPRIVSVFKGPQRGINAKTAQQNDYW